MVTLDNLFNNARTGVSTFTANREVSIVDIRLSSMYWVLVVVTGIYVGYDISYGHHYLEKTIPTGTVEGFGLPGTMYDTDRPLPKYCQPPYTDDYVDGTDDWTHVNTSCASYPMTEVMLKRTPDYLFFATTLYERTYSITDCSVASGCTRQTSAVRMLPGGSCMCIEYKNHYVINPEVPVCECSTDT